jgi:hypothetical protein
MQTIEVIVKHAVRLNALRAPYLRSSLLAGGVALALALGCGGESSGADAAIGPDANFDPQLDDPPAFVVIDERSDNAGGVGSTTITAVLSATRPAFYAEVARDGACRLLTGDSGFCRDPCDGACTSDGTCVPFPTQLGAGDITIDGLIDPVVLAPTQGNIYGAFTAGPMMQPGVSITASAPGDEFGAFSLSVEPVEPLVVTDPEQLELRAGAALDIRWTPSSRPGARVRLTLNSDTAFHGLIHPAVIECDAPDTGRLTVPASLIDPYVEPANWGCGDCAESSLARYRVSTQTVDGVDLALRTASRVGLFLAVF